MIDLFKEVRLYLRIGVGIASFIYLPSIWNHGQVLSYCIDWALFILFWFAILVVISLCVGGLIPSLYPHIIKSLGLRPEDDDNDVSTVSTTEPIPSPKSNNTYHVTEVDDDDHHRVAPAVRQQGCVSSERRREMELTKTETTQTKKKKTKTKTKMKLVETQTTTASGTSQTCEMSHTKEYSRMKFETFFEEKKKLFQGVHRAVDNSQNGPNYNYINGGSSPEFQWLNGGSHYGGAIDQRQHYGALPCPNDGSQYGAIQPWQQYGAPQHDMVPHHWPYDMGWHGEMPYDERSAYGYGNGPYGSSLISYH